jgi:hypothetical protein
MDLTLIHYIIAAQAGVIIALGLQVRRDVHFLRAVSERLDAAHSNMLVLAKRVREQNRERRQDHEA